MIPGAFGVGALPAGAQGVRHQAHRAGRDLWSRVGGFRRVLSTPSSKERFDFSGREDLYTAYIPWAVAFGCADAWAEKYRTESGRRSAGAGVPGRAYSGDRTGNYVDEMVGDFSRRWPAPSRPTRPPSRPPAAAGEGSPAAEVAAAVAAVRGDAALVPHQTERGVGPCRSLIVLVVVVLFLVAFVVVGFNKLRTADIAAQEALGGIDVQLTRRADLIPNLVETVKGYAAHEKGVFEEVTGRAPAYNRPRPARRPGEGRRGRAAAGRADQPQRGRRELPRPQGEPELPGPPEAARRHREPDLLRPAVLQRRHRDLEQARADHPVDVLHRDGRRAPA